MCRQGGYYDQAVFLAKKNDEHELVIDILIEDSKKYEDALDFIWRLSPETAYPNLMKYARVLLEHCQEEATQIFIDYYTGQYRSRRNVPVPTLQEPQGGGTYNVGNLTAFLPLPYRQASVNPSPGTAGNQQLAGSDAADAEAAQAPPEYDIPKPRTAFAAFVDHPESFITFLEACLKQANIDKSDLTDLYTALFEMYLQTANTKKGEEKGTWEAKAKRLIDDKDVSDTLNMLRRTADRTLDSNRCIECIIALASLEFPRRYHPSQRAARSSFRHLPVLHFCQRYCWGDQSFEEVWP